MQFNKEQQEALNSFISGKSVFVSASAGTGKTTMLVHSYIRLLEKNVAPSEIVAITFTKNAANEMLIKIRSLIRDRVYKSHNEDKKKWLNIYNNFSKEANVSTIDSYASSIIATYGYYLDILPNVNISSGTDHKCEKIMDSVIENILKNKEKYKSIYNPMKLYISTNKKEFINQMISFTNMIKPRAGSFDIFEKMVRSIFEIKDSIKNIHIKINDNINQILTFEHNGKTVNALQNLVNKYKDKIIDIDDIKNLDKHQIKILLTELETFSAGIKCGTVKIFKDIAAELRDINLAKYHDIIFKIYYKDYIENIILFMEELFTLYENKKILNNILTFDDLVEKSCKLLENKNIQNNISNKIKYVIVDETQDTNNLQYNFINLLLFGTKNIDEKILDNSDKIAFIVGDRKQSIYRFRNANINSFLNYGNIFEKSKNSNTIYLKTNYRSDEYLINFFNNFFENVFLGDSINYADSDNLSPNDSNNNCDKKISFLMLNQNLSNGDEKINSDEQAMLEANAFARYIEKELENDSNIEYNKFALLLPTLKRLHYYIEAFTKYKIPFYIYSGSGFFSRPEINNIIFFLKYLILKEDSLISFIVRKEFFDITENHLYIINKILVENNYSLKDVFKDTNILYLFDNFFEIKNTLTHIRNTILELSYYSSFENASNIINLIISKTNYNSYLMTKPDGDFAFSNIEKFIEKARLYERQTGENIYDFLENIDNLIQEDDRYSTVPLLKVNAISIMSIHASKGLEFDNILLGELRNRRLSNFNKCSFTFIDDHPHIPIYTDDYSVVGLSEIDKETNSDREHSQRKRLLYVALTRAKKNLVVSGENSNKTSYRQFFDEYYQALNKENIFDDNDTIYNNKIPCSENITDLIHISEFNNSIQHKYIDIYIYGYGILNKFYLDKSNMEKHNSKLNINYIENKIKSANIIIERASQTNSLDEPELYNIKECLTNLISEYDENKDNIEIKEVSIMTVGTIVHNLFEIFDYNQYKIESDTYIQKLITKAKFEIKNYNNKNSALEKIEHAIHNYINSIHTQNILNGKETIVMREHSFEKRIEEENSDIKIIRSKIDLVTKDAENIYYIIDYKLSSFKNGVENKYKNQMQTYKDFIMNIFNLEKEQVRADVILLLDGTTINIED